MNAFSQATGRDISERKSGAVKLSIIIPVLNEERMIGCCLDALRRVSFAPKEFEIIIVDNGSTDKTLEVVSSFRDCFDLTILQCPPGVHISSLRNLGAKEARGKILAFLDADCIAPTGWPAEAERLLRDTCTGVVGSFYLLPQHSSWIATVWYKYHYYDKVGDVQYVPTGDLLVLRSTFFSVGGFDEGLETNEDYYFCQRVSRTGKSVRALPSLGVVHLGTPQTVRSFYRQQRWHGKHVLKVFLRCPWRRDNLKAISFSLFTLAGLIAVIVGIVVRLVTGDVKVLISSVFTLVLVSALMGIRTAGIGKCWTDAFPLAVLYLTFGIARALCLLQWSYKRTPRDIREAAQRTTSADVV